MKPLMLLFWVQLIIGLCISCKAQNQVSQQNTILMNGNKINIKVGNKLFTAKLLNNPTAIAFKALLPLTLNMEELNRNEKYAQLPQSIPTNASVPVSIHSGDLMMYGSNTFVLFYKGFSTSYPYTKLGNIDNVSGLVVALGSGNVSVTFELSNK